MSIWVRLAPKLHLVTHAWLAVQTLLALGSLGWRRYRPASFARLREVQAAVFRLNGAGFGAALLMLRSLIDEIEPSVPGGADGGAKAAARHAVLLLQAGSVVPMVLWWVTPLRFW